MQEEVTHVEQRGAQELGEWSSHRPAHQPASECSGQLAINKLLAPQIEKKKFCTRTVKPLAAAHAERLGEKHGGHAAGVPASHRRSHESWS